MQEVTGMIEEYDVGCFQSVCGFKGTVFSLKLRTVFSISMGRKQEQNGFL